LHNGERRQILEAIDAIGFISYYKKDTSSLDDIINLIHKYKNDNLMIWKLIRALQSFKYKKVLNLLEVYAKSNIEQLQWEAIRSLNQIHRKSNESKK